MNEQEEAEEGEWPGRCAEMGSEEDPQDDGGAGWQGVRTHTKNERLTDLSRIWLFYHTITSRFSWANATSSLIKRKLLGEGGWGRRENKRKKKLFGREIYGGRITHGQENQLLADIVS